MFTMIDTVPVFTKGKIELTKRQLLPVAKVRQIKDLLNQGVPVKVIAIEFNRSQCSIYAIKHGLSYRDII
jgi:hypothetical protein